MWEFQIQYWGLNPTWVGLVVLNLLSNNGGADEFSGEAVMQIRDLFLGVVDATLGLPNCVARRTSCAVWKHGFEPGERLEILED